MEHGWDNYNNVIVIQRIRKQNIFKCCCLIGEFPSGEKKIEELRRGISAWDFFFTLMHHCYQKHGFTCMMLHEVLELGEFVFLSFYFLFVVWTILFYLSKYITFALQIYYYYFVKKIFFIQIFNVIISFGTEIKETKQMKLVLLSVMQFCHG